MLGDTASAEQVLPMSMTWTNSCPIVLAGFVLLGGCTDSGRRISPGPPQDQAASLQAGQIIETATGQSIPLDQLLARVSRQEVLYLGEEHHNRYHVEAALSLLNHLTTEGFRPFLAMEMFGWDGQASVDRYLEGSTINREEFLEQINWKQNWGGPFEDYEPLVSFAKAHHLTLAALNPPKTLVRSIARHGLSQARLEPGWTAWGMQDETIVDDPGYRQLILRQLRACHDGGSDALYQTMYEASMVRDEGMAKTIVSLVETVRSAGDSTRGPIVSYTGGGHIQYNLPVPKRVTRRLGNPVRQMSIYMMAFESGRSDDLREMIEEKIADFVWLTPVGSHGPPHRCG